MVFPAFTQTTYSEEDLFRLCEFAEIATDHAARLGGELEKTAAIFRYYNAGKEDSAPNYAAKRELEVIAKNAAKLAQQLENMSTSARQAFRKKIDRDAVQSLNADKSEASFFLSLADFETSLTGVLLDEASLANLLRAGEVAAKTGTEGLPKQKRGRPFDMGLHMWMVNIANIWDEFSPLPFTCGVTDHNDPVSPAALFCELAFKSLSPETPVSRIMSAQKEIITKRLKERGEN